MAAVIKDNREILRYRGLISPGSETLNAQAQQASLAVINASSLSTNIINQYYDSSRISGTEATRTNAYMRLLGESGNASPTLYDFFFPYTPQNIQYSDMSDEVAEIPRAGTTPLVAFKSHKLMRVSFEFLVAVPYDGMTIDVENSLNILRTFSTNSNRSVVFYHFDQLLMAGWQYRRGPSDRPPHFTIVEMNISAKQRNSLGRITQAVVNMTFVENHNPLITVVKVPPFTKGKPKKKKEIGGNIPRVTKVHPYTDDAKNQAAQESSAIYLPGSKATGG